MQLLAQPASEGFVAKTGDDAEVWLGCNTCTVADRFNLPKSNNRAIQNCIECH